ncbi:hypothetical protein [Lentibacillus sp. Marseille-P4043]|uniref:hypothetical protein n=1 Tax=Lentibacillus sp. Marseille-P4043 TaxID=2040293 RepID=UPI000D0B8F89|nr:hypothetical protein [Lentibacillus sp. Marseille-P4043]
MMENSDFDKNMLTSNRYYSKYLSIYKAVGYKVFLRYKNDILYYSNKLRVDPEIVFFLITNEQINRGDFFTKIIEKFVAIFRPNLAIKKDISIGLGQIKISIANNATKRDVVPKQLLKPKWNIYCVAHIVKSMDYDDTCVEECIPKIVTAYTIGNDSRIITKEMYLYIKLSKWSYLNRYFHSLTQHMQN